MVGRRCSKFAVLAAGAAAVLSILAPAAVAEGEAETGGFGVFFLKGTNGYSAIVLAASKPQFKHGQALVLLGRGGESVFYLASAKVTATTIDADLGPVGEIAVEFQSSGPPERVDAPCEEGESMTYEPGVWVGTIELEGEEGFTRIEEDRVKATVSPFLAAECGGATLIGESTGPHEPGARLAARSATAKHAVYLQANKNHPGARVYLEASIEERRRGLIVSREVRGYYPSGAFEFGSPLRTATLAPPGRFVGHATFRRGAKPANRWTGNLSVDFPGHADVALAGGGFKTALVHAKRTEERTVRDRLARAASAALLSPSWPRLGSSLLD